MQLKLVTPERQLLDTEVEEVYAPGIAGEFGILPGHINFMTALTVGVMRYRSEGRDHYVAVSGGFAEVANDVVTILADAAEPANEIDAQRATSAADRARAALDRVAANTPEQFDIQSALSRALNRLAVASRAPHARV